LKKLKPEGKSWEYFVKSWYERGHAGKLMLCSDIGVSYDVAKHWISDSGSTRKVVKEETSSMDVDDILAIETPTKLDFVCIDLETSNLNADFSILLTACIKPFGLEPIIFRADNYSTWEKKRSDDSQITKDIANELRKHAIVIGHYSQKFDIPFLRAKMVKHGLAPLPPMFGIDTWRIAINNFKVSSRRLVSLGNFFDLGDKSGVEGSLWMSGAYEGNKEAMNKIVEHNIQDVIILEKLACLSFPYLKAIPKL